MGALDGKVALVTGAGRGIGAAVAALLGAEGASVVVNDPGVNTDGTGHDNGPAEQTASAIVAAGGEAQGNFDSVAEAAGGEAMVEQAVAAYGRLDILVNCAGILRDRMIFNMTQQEWDAVIAVHLSGHFNTIRPASLQMRAQRAGRIINFTSVSGLLGNPGQVNYGAAKAAIAGLTRVAARDLGRYGVTVNAVSPVAATRMTAEVPGGGSGRGSAPRSAFGGMREAEDVAPMVGYLASDYAWNINGQIFHVQGGRVSLAHQPLPEHTILTPTPPWTLAELDDGVHYVLMRRRRNPSPPPEDVEVAGRDVTPRALE